MSERAYNIWSISQYAAPPRYGLGTGHFYLGREHVKAGHRVRVFASTENHILHGAVDVGAEASKVEVHDGVEFVWLKGLTYGDSHGFWRVMNWFTFIVRFLRTPKNEFGRPDIVIVSSHSVFPVICGVWCKLRYGCKMIVEIRDIWPRTLVDIGGHSRWHPLVVLMGFVEKLGYRSADWIVSTLPNADEHIAQRLRGAPFEFTCIPQGIAREILDAENGSCPSSVQVREDGKYFMVGYAGAVGPSNALETLIGAARLLAGDLPEAKFLILGSGRERDRLREAAADCPNVTFLPRVERKEVQGFLRQCDVLYDGVRKRELYRFGLSRQKWIDYMMAGRPLVVSYSGFRSMVEEAGCGSFVPAEDPEALAAEIARYARMDPRELEQMGRHGREWVLRERHFEKLARAWEEIFERVCRARPA